MLSVVIPAYDEEQMLHKTAETIKTILDNEKIEFEILFVNDGSKDDTWNLISEEGKNDARIRGVGFSRNFGKESAIFAGLAEVKGDCTVVIDCDLQHPPIKIVEMYKLWEQGYEVIEGVKSSRGKESRLHAMAAKMFYNMISKASGIDMSRASDFKLLDRKVVDELLKLPEKAAFFRALSSWVGFKTIQIEYDVQQREEGVSKWSTKSLIKYAISNITSFTTLPMQIVSVIGVIMMVLSVVCLISFIYKSSINTNMALLFLLLGLQCFIGGVILIGIGIVGYYISKIYDEVKKRPRYIISQRIN